MEENYVLYELAGKPASGVVVLVTDPPEGQRLRQLEETVNLLSLCIANQRHELEAIEQRGGIDSLTGLHWRDDERRKTWPSSGSAYAVIDLRRLHSANQRYGHEVVDEQGFKPFGDYMARNFRKEDLVTRTRGQSDEFQVTAYNCTPEELDLKLLSMQKEYEERKVGLVFWDYAVGESILQADNKLTMVKARRNPLNFALLSTKKVFSSARDKISGIYNSIFDPAYQKA